MSESKANPDTVDGCGPSAGPWEAVATSIRDANGQDFASCSFGDETISVDYANARLIAAAPDLLEASKEALAVIDSWNMPEDFDVKAKLENAIAKATGV